MALAGEAAVVVGELLRAGNISRDMPQGGVWALWWLSPLRGPRSAHSALSGGIWLAVFRWRDGGPVAWTTFGVQSFP